MPYLRLSDNYSQMRMGRITSTRRRKLLLSYAPDWILTIALAAIFFSLNKVEGFKRQFSLSDTSLRHTFAVHERVPDYALYLIAVVAPLLLQPIINLLTIRSWWDLHNGTLGLILGLTITGSITQFTKVTVGRPRPDIIDRCQPINGSTDPTYGLSTAAICTQGDLAILRDGFRSFPSGHSSLSFAGLGFLAFYLAGKLHLFDHRGHAGKAWLSLTPFAGAALVAISRTMDYRHHWQDVLVGSILGTVMSYFAYRQYYPSLGSELSHKPYSPRVKREQDALPLHHHRPPSGLDESDFAHTLNQGQSYSDTTPPHAPGTTIELAETPEGTVRRPDPGSLREIWREGHEGDIEST